MILMPKRYFFGSSDTPFVKISRRCLSAILAIGSVLIVFENVASADSCTVAGNLALYQSKNCDKCHGADGQGLGDWNQNLPRAFQGESFTSGNFKVASCDSSFRDVIRQGGAAFGLSPLMPAHPASAVSDEELECLISIIRDFKSE
jgi:hypothetical protein